MDATVLPRLKNNDPSITKLDVTFGDGGDENFDALSVDIGRKREELSSIILMSNHWKFGRVM